MFIFIASNENVFTVLVNYSNPVLNVVIVGVRITMALRWKERFFGVQVGLMMKLLPQRCN